VDQPQRDAPLDKRPHRAIEYAIGIGIPDGLRNKSIQISAVAMMEK
jgi:hypothetical protein